MYTKEEKTIYDEIMDKLKKDFTFFDKMGFDDLLLFIMLLKRYNYFDIYKIDVDSMSFYEYLNHYSTNK